MFQQKIIGTAALLAGLLASPGVGAALVTITESADSSSVTLSGCDFNQFSANGSTSPCGSGVGNGAGGSVTVTEPGSISFGGNWLFGGGVANRVDRSVYWVAAPGSSTITHILNFSASSTSVAGFPGGFNAFFSSGSNLGTLSSQVSASDIFVDGTSASFLFDALRIDVSTVAAPPAPGTGGTTPVPEPSAAALIGLGLAALGFGRRRTA